MPLTEWQPVTSLGEATRPSPTLQTTPAARVPARFPARDHDTAGYRSTPPILSSCRHTSRSQIRPHSRDQNARFACFFFRRSARHFATSPAASNPSKMRMRPTPLKRRGGGAGRNAAQKTDHLLNCRLITVRVREPSECGSKTGPSAGQGAASAPKESEIRRGSDRGLKCAGS
jgi:hypothetical protein